MSEANKIIDKFFADIVERGFVPQEDIAWVGVPLQFLQQLGELSICPVRHCFYCVINGVEFRECVRKNSADIKLEGWFAWNKTKRTKKLFNMNDQE